MNKSLLKISGIISIVLGIICCLTIFGAIIGVPLIIGGNKIKDMANLSDQELLQQKDTILIWMVVFLVFNQISGILLLIFYIDMDGGISSSFKGNNNNDNKYDELEKLKKLYDDKVLTKEEFETEKEKILNK